MITKLQPLYCNNSMTRVFNFIKEKTIDISKLSNSMYPVFPLLKTWGIVDTFDETGELILRNLIYTDKTDDNLYKYLISISIVNKKVTLSCNSNPVTDCMCIYTHSLDIDGNVSYDMPFNVIDDALSKLSFITSISECVPNWVCRQPLDGYEHDSNNCPGSVDRLNSNCKPTIIVQESNIIKYVALGSAGLILIFYLYKMK